MEVRRSAGRHELGTLWEHTEDHSKGIGNRRWIGRDLGSELAGSGFRSLEEADLLGNDALGDGTPHRPDDSLTPILEEPPFYHAKDEGSNCDYEEV